MPLPGLNQVSWNAWKKGRKPSTAKLTVSPPVFMVVATQNPIELQGTYPLPEAQLDRFFMRFSIGYPAAEQEVRIMEMQVRTHPINSLAAVLPDSQLREMQEAVNAVHIEKTIKAYIVKIVDATRRHPDILLGASPRGSLGLMRASLALAFLRGKDYVEPTMVKIAVQPVLAHGLNPSLACGVLRKRKFSKRS